MKSLVLLAVSFFSINAAAQGTLVTVAGTGVSGFSGDGGDAKLANISELLLSAVITDGDGNVFFVDPGNYRIRRVDRKTGVITTFAGNGGRGYTGDGGSATSAEINKPFGMTFDWKNNLVFQDTVYCRIRSISTTGIVNYWGGTTCGYDGDGGLVNAAKFMNSTLLAADSGRLLLAQTEFIRSVDKAGVVTKIAGSGYGFLGDGGLAIYARMSGVVSMAFDRSGMLSFVDIGARRVRHINSKNVINTIVGNGLGYSGDGGKASAAGLGQPWGIAYDQFGNLFIAAAYRIRKVDAKDSLITTIAGTGVNAYSGEGVDAKISSIGATSIWLDTAHYEIYFAEGARIRKISNLVKPVSIKETAKVYSPEIFPNPATTQIAVSGIPIRSEIWIYDLLGREQYHTTMQQMEETVDVSKLVPGTYILRARTPKGVDVYARWMKG